jgi:uncharacterized protein
VSAASPAERSIECPVCGARTVFAPSNPWRPFCSERCRRTDLGAWASESYRIAAKPAPDEAGADPQDSES